MIASCRKDVFLRQVGNVKAHCCGTKGDNGDTFRQFQGESKPGGARYIEVMQVVKAYCVCFIIWILNHLQCLWPAVLHKLVGALRELPWSGMCYFLVGVLSAVKRCPWLPIIWNQHLSFPFCLVSVEIFCGHDSPNFGNEKNTVKSHQIFSWPVTLPGTLSCWAWQDMETALKRGLRVCSCFFSTSLLVLCLHLPVPYIFWTGGV